MFATQRLAASATGVCWAGAWQVTGRDGDSPAHETRWHDGHRPGLARARDSSGITGIPHNGLSDSSGTTGTPHDGRSDSSGTTGIPHNGRADSSGTTGTPHDGLSDSSGTTGIPHNGRADSSGPCPAWA